MPESFLPPSKQSHGATSIAGESSAMVNTRSGLIIFVKFPKGLH